MTTSEHERVLGIGFGFFAVIIGLTMLLLMIVSFGVFVGVGMTLANETGDSNQAGIGILGAVFTIVFYCALGAVFVLPPALAAWKTLKRRPKARTWAIIAAIVIMPFMPLGTILGIYALWFLFRGQGSTDMV